MLSHSARIYNIKLDQIEEIMNNDGSGDIMGHVISMPCRIENGVLMTFFADCTTANMNEIMNHYKLRRELNLINKVKDK